jgi:hypothetical protein
VRGFWTCQKGTDGIKCGALNPNRNRKCKTCGKTKRDRSSERPKHLSALDLPYSHYVAINGGEFCAICGATPKPGGVLNRDHAHVGVGIPRGLLCWRHNQALEMFGDDPKLLRAAATYLERPR